MRFPDRTWPENAMPTPEQWVEWFNRCSHAARLVLAEQILSDRQTATACFLRHQEPAVRDLDSKGDFRT